MASSIIIVDYDPRWPVMYPREQQRILAAMGHHAVAIEHIGSTAVPGLAAKPILDIMVGVCKISDVHDCIAPLQSIGYEYIPYPDFPERLFFRDGPMGKGPHHLHVTELMSGFWREKLLFRDQLRAQPGVAQEYAHLKRELASKYGADRERYEPYTEAKTPFIERVLGKSAR